MVLWIYVRYPVGMCAFGSSDENTDTTLEFALGALVDGEDTLYALDYNSAISFGFIWVNMSELGEVVTCNLNQTATTCHQHFKPS